MTNKIIVFFMLISIIFSIFNDTTGELSKALLESSGMSVQTVITLVGTMALWGGVMKVAKSSGLTNKICRLIKYPIKFLFPEIDDKSSAFECISMNITANLLGLGNAATPLGLKAMKELKESNCPRKCMTKLVVLNSASIQLIPVTVATLRLSNGSESPWDFVPAVLIVSLTALISGLIMVKALNYNKNKDLT